MPTWRSSFLSVSLFYLSLLYLSLFFSSTIPIAFHLRSFSSLYCFLTASVFAFDFLANNFIWPIRCWRLTREKAIEQSSLSTSAWHCLVDSVYYLHCLHYRLSVWTKITVRLLLNDRGSQNAPCQKSDILTVAYRWPTVDCLPIAT